MGPARVIREEPAYLGPRRLLGGRDSRAGPWPHLQHTLVSRASVTKHKLWTLLRGGGALKQAGISTRHPSPRGGRVPTRPPTPMFCRQPPPLQGQGEAWGPREKENKQTKSNRFKEVSSAKTKTKTVLPRFFQLFLGPDIEGSSKSVQKALGSTGRPSGPGNEGRKNLEAPFLLLPNGTNHTPSVLSR